MAYIAGASAAAPKDALFRPYTHDHWIVRAIIWTMILAASGMRKTPLLRNAFSALERHNAKRYTDYEREKKHYETLSGEALRDAERPEEPHTLIIKDYTEAALQAVLVSSPRGTAILREELTAILDFGRFSQGSGVSSRSFLVECYDGGPGYVHRKSGGGRLIPNQAVSIFGCTQPARLAEFKNLDNDGLLPRFVIISPGQGNRDVSLRNIQVRGQDRLDQMITHLATFTARQYRTSPAGTAMIQQTEEEGYRWADAIDYGLGFPAWARKMHGTHARLALVLHMMEAPENEIITDDVVERAGRLTLDYLLSHAVAFYSVLPDGGLALSRSIAGWLLTKAPDRFTAGVLGQNVAACRGKPLRFIQDALSPLVAGDWLTPESGYPDNNAWNLTDGLREAFAERTEAEAERRAVLRAMMRRRLTAP